MMQLQHSAPLCEIHNSQHDGQHRSPPKPTLGGEGGHGRTSSEQQTRSRPRSPTKSAFSKLRSKSRDRDRSPEKTPQQQQTQSPKKQKSSTNLAGLLSRPKSSKNLHNKMLVDEEVTKLKAVHDKENTAPAGSGVAGSPFQAPTPIFAQFTSDASYKGQQQQHRQQTRIAGGADDGMREQNHRMNSRRPEAKARPISIQAAPVSRPKEDSQRVSPRDGPTERGRSKFSSAFSGKFGHGRSKSTTVMPDARLTTSVDQLLKPEDIDRHLEAMLDRRNIPENQRYKMRNLNNTIKMEFIRQDWAEMQAAKAEQGSPAKKGGEARTASGAVADGSDTGDEGKPKRSRGKSFTITRGRKDGKSSNTSATTTKKSKGEGTLGRHFRSKSTDSIASGDRPASSSANSSTTSLLNKFKAQQGPSDYVNYLRKEQRPELVEVGKLHKLRLLLRNETVSWIEEFMQLGGMKEIVNLLRRVMEVEWREEHEDALLHENLLCLKALSTTARAMQYLHAIQGELFPKLLSMLFDPERKGPSEFTTRNIITSILFTYLEAAPAPERTMRAQTLLLQLRDPEPEEHNKPLPFVLEMRQQRPYRVWCKEVVSVTKEVFWIFLHNLNVISLPSGEEGGDGTKSAGFGDAADPAAAPCKSYMQQHFPRQRPPVPAAPYVGGVEWDATNYLASHLDLLNAILASTPSQEERNAIRAELRISGWERCLGGTLRLCKEKFYGSVHDGLRTWVAAAAADGWRVRDVRFGPAPETRASPKKAVGGGGANRKKVDDAPKLDLPQLNIAMEQPRGSSDAWL